MVGLPVIERRDIEAAGAAARSTVATYAFTSYTSGTVSGRPLMIDRSTQEQAWLRRFFRALDEPSDEPPRLVLALATMHHGRRLGVPSRAYSFPVSLNGEAGCAQAVGLLDRTYPIDGEERRITEVAGSLFGLQLLSGYLVASGREDLTERIRAIWSGSGYVTRRAWSRAELEWGCRLTDRFSLTEMVLGASSCRDCGLYHFDLHGIAEVVEPNRDRPLSEGRGRLVLTAFYPFSQMTPFLRYATGDLAERVAVDCRQGVVGYRMLGRTASSLDVSAELGEPGFLAGGDVYEALDPIAEAARPLVGERFGRAGQRIVGMPIYELRRDGDGVQVVVELRFVPDLHPDAAERIRQTVETNLTAASPEGTELEGRGRLRVRLVGPGTLDDSRGFRP
jgi:hypothetical protein